MSSSSTTYRHGVLRINPKAQLTEAITSAKGAKATWDNEPEDICEAAAVDPPPSKTFTQNLREAVQSRIDEAYARRSRNIRIHKHLRSVRFERKEDEVQLQADKEKLREYLKEAEAQLKKSEEDEAQLLESKEREAQLYAEKEKLREQVRLLQESHETEIRQKDTEIWNLKGELHYNNAYACRREMSLKQ